MDSTGNVQGAAAFSNVEGEGTRTKLSLPANIPTNTQPEEDRDYCRICRGEGTAEQPLFYPCKCSGSIRFVHQDCLMEWLSHSQKKYCELCKTPFTFTKLYDRSMPETLPLPLFLRQIILHSARGLLKWTRFFMVGFVWLGWLPWSIRQVWRGLFWLADGSWISPTGVGGATVATVNSTASLLASDSSPLTSSLAYANLSSAAIKTELANPIPETFAPISAFLTLATDDFLIVKLIRLLFPNFLRWATRVFSGTYSAAEATTSNRATRLPSLLSDVTYFETLTTNSVINNAIVDVLEGQLICLLIVTAFILIFLIREWVINQQPAANVPDPDRVEDAADPLRVNRELRPGVRRRRRGVREALDQHERGQDPGRPPVIEGPRFPNVPPPARREDPDALADRSTQEDLQQAQATSRTSHAPDSTTLETNTLGIGISARSPTPVPPPDVRPTLHVRNALDQASDIRRKIEEGTADLGDIDLVLSSRGMAHDGAWDDFYVADSNFADLAGNGHDALTDPEIESFSSSHNEPEIVTNAGNEAPDVVISDVSQGSIFPAPVVGLASGDHETIDVDPQFSDDSSSQIVDVVVPPETSSTHHDAQLSDTDGEQLTQTPASTSGEEEPTIWDGDDNVNPRLKFWDQVANWL